MITALCQIISTFPLRTVPNGKPLLLFYWERVGKVKEKTINRIEQNNSIEEQNFFLLHLFSPQNYMLPDGSISYIELECLWRVEKSSSLGTLIARTN